MQPPADRTGDEALLATLRLADEIDLTVVAANPILGCPSDCARCCHQQLFISEGEWAIALQHLHTHQHADERRRIVRTARRLVDRRRGALRKVLRAKTIADLSEAATAVDDRRTVRCAFLSDDDRCSVYPARPLICRVYSRVMRRPGVPMLCQIFIDRMKQSNLTRDHLQLPQFQHMRQTYLHAGAADERFSALAVFVVWHEDGMGDLLREPRPLPRDGSLLALTRAEMAHI